MAGQSSGLAFRKACLLISVSSQPGWLCSTGMATSWITCPSRSSTTFSRASCTSTPRASGHGALCSTLPWSSANTPAPRRLCPSRFSPNSVFPSPHLDCFPHLLTQPPTVWGNLQRTPQRTPPPQPSLDKLSSRLRVGVGDGVGVGEVRSLEMCGCPSPSMLWGGGSGPRLPSMPFTTKGYLFPFFLIFRFVVSFVGCCCCSLLIELGSNPCPRFFMSVALLRFCGIPSLLTGYRSQASALRKLREGYAR